jgi:hypothetical protein
MIGNIPIFMAEVYYGIVFHDMNAVLNYRLNRISNLLQKSFMIGVASSLFLLMFLTMFLPLSSLTMFLSFCAFCFLGVIICHLKIFFSFGPNSLIFEKAKYEFLMLEIEGWHLCQADLEKQLKKLQNKWEPLGGNILKVPAYNKTCIELGFPDFVIKETFIAKILGKLSIRQEDII